MTPPASKKSPAKRVTKPVRASKSAAKKKAPKALKLTGKIPSAARKVTRSRKSAKSAGTVEVVRPPLVDVTPEMKKDVVVVKPEPVQAAQPAAQPVEKHEDFAKSLTEEPKKKGFLSRLFGRNS